MYPIFLVCYLQMSDLQTTHPPWIRFCLVDLFSTRLFCWPFSHWQADYNIQLTFSSWRVSSFLTFPMDLSCHLHHCYPAGELLSWPFCTDKLIVWLTFPMEVTIFLPYLAGELNAFCQCSPTEEGTNNGSVECVPRSYRDTIANVY